MQAGFGVWITGLPASGKSTLARALAGELERAGLRTQILDSDALRLVFTPCPTYTEGERDCFYDAMGWIGEMLVRHGVAVVFAASANRMRHRDRARSRIERFIEVFVDCPLKTCMDRDPRGIYRKALSGEASTVPGIQTPYEAPAEPEVTVHTDRESPEIGVGRVMEALRTAGYVPV